MISNSISIVGAVIVTFFAFLGQCYAAKIDVVPSEPVAAIFISGPIQTGDSQKFKDLTVNVNSKAVITLLSSEGGSANEAIEIGQTIQKRNWSTSAPQKIDNSSRCSGACALIWLAGRNRYLDSKSKIGFNLKYDEEMVFKPELNMNALRVIFYMTILQISPATISKIFNPEVKGTLWINTQIATDLGIVVTNWQNNK